MFARAIYVYIYMYWWSSHGQLVTLELCLIAWQNETSDINGYKIDICIYCTLQILKKCLMSNRNTSQIPSGMQGDSLWREHWWVVGQWSADYSIASMIDNVIWQDQSKDKRFVCIHSKYIYIYTYIITVILSFLPLVCGCFKLVYIYILYRLVVSTPLKNVSSSVGMMTFPILMEK
jgi:hypothetical protein